MQAGRIRRCIVSGVSEHEAALVRFALSPDGVIAADVAARAPGRGVWVRADRAQVGLAVKRQLFARALKRPATAPLDLADRVELALVQRCMDLLGLARRAGGLAFGYQACVDALRRQRPLWHIEARDGAAEGRRRFLAMAREAKPPAAPVCGCFTGAEIGMALGRDDVVHAMVLQEGLAQRWTVEMGRLAGFRAITPPEWS
jgi:predicted RNA-binding protein YlxR (DUF448 family)